jgi:hypothetical protein
MSDDLGTQLTTPVDIQASIPQRTGYTGIVGHVRAQM